MQYTIKRLLLNIIFLKLIICAGYLTGRHLTAALRKPCGMAIKICMEQRYYAEKDVPGFLTTSMFNPKLVTMMRGGSFTFTAQDNRALKKIEVTNGYFPVPNPKSFK
jgi:hypothetical protein